jgi:cytidyltransferase-like protein
MVNAIDSTPGRLDAPLAMLGGTFDPVHYGHLRLADDVRRALALAEVRLVPAADPRDRVAMLELAYANFRGSSSIRAKSLAPGKAIRSTRSPRCAPSCPARRCCCCSARTSFAACRHGIAGGRCSTLRMLS